MLVRATESGAYAQVQFTKLRLTGFKSFVDPTDMIISEGLTGVVGPNGCGKSNLLEALRWVMGENRPTAMRGSGMEDVIFAGAETRPQRHYAEVALMIDNGDRTAPSGFNDHDRIEIIRRITRDAGSAFKANGKDVRARDVQMLFADASTGSHSPALVRQGQISELINAKPRARRRILEEAAGISGLYQRRHEAELKLGGAETNLTRVEDILEQLKSQISTLARQARQAARYREIGEELRRSEGLLLYRRWREADEALASSSAELGRLTAEAARAQAAVDGAARMRGECESRVPPLREEEAVAAAILQRLLVQRDTLREQEERARAAIETLTSGISQLGADIAREQALGSDAVETVERLEWEQTALEKAALGHDDKLRDAEEAAHAAGAELGDFEARLGEMTEDVARLSAQHQSAQRLLADGRATLKRNESEATRARESAAATVQRLEDLRARFESAGAAQEQAAQAAAMAQDALISAEKERVKRQSDEAEARAERSEAEGEVKALSAETSALARLLDRDRSGEESILDLLRVEKGFEAALGAALGDDLNQPETGDRGGSGWTLLREYDATPPLPPEAVSLAGHLSAPPVLARRMSQVGVVDAADGDRLQASLLPGQRLVSQQGHLWRWDGLSTVAGDAPSAAAIRLQQINRLEQLTVALEDAKARAFAAANTHDSLSDRLRQAIAHEKTCRQARSRTDDALAQAARDVSRSESDLNLSIARAEAAQLSVRRFEDEATANRARMQAAESATGELADLDEARTGVETMKTTVQAARMAMLSRRSIADEIRHEGDARIRRRQEIAKEISGWKLRQRTAGTRIADLQDRRSKAETELAAARSAPGEIAEKRDLLGASIHEAETRRARAADALAQSETALREAVRDERETESDAANLRESRARAEAVMEAAQARVQATADRIREDLGIGADELLNTLGGDPDEMPSSERIEMDVARLRRQREALGAVNLRAEEDAREIREEFENLTREKSDLEAAIAKLRTGISNLNREGRERLLAAFEQVNLNFEGLFKHLFGGGEAKLVLVESDDPLEAGLEIMCQPPGKKLSTLSLLSGVEKYLSALALIFAVFMANPAPICVLDEVDAPLDDANVGRFCDLLDEMARRTETRFIIITHHAVSMSRMDRLFGVTMVEKGVSQLVSVDLSRAEQLVA
ncbi:MAG: chromosome segregation protein SMC [Paracoccaceae bacterium]